MSETSDAQILIDIDKWKKSAAYYLVDDEKQMGRVILVTVGCEWYTLREIEKLIAGKYPEHMDTPAAISARLREVSPYKHGLVKQKFLKMENKKQVWRYRLVPALPVREVAERVGIFYA